MTILLSLTLVIIIVAINSLNYYKTTEEENRVLEYYITSQLPDQQPRGGEPNEPGGDPNNSADGPSDSAGNPNNSAGAPNNSASDSDNSVSNPSDSVSEPANQNNMLAPGEMQNTPNPNENASEPPQKPLNNEFNNQTSQDTPNANDSVSNTDQPDAPPQGNPPSDNGGFTPFPYNPQINQSAQNEMSKVASLYSLIYVKCTKSGTIDVIQTNHSTTYTKEELQKYCTQIIQSNESKGKLDNLKYQKSKSQNGYDIAFINLTNARSSNKNLLIYSVLLGIIGIFIFTAISYLISGLMIKPVETAFTRQEEFIAAASHELKTPLTVIQANSEIVEDQFGKSKWLTYIQTECDRMNQLISSLLTLAKLEQSTEPGETMYECNLSEAFMERILPFESVAFEKNFTFTYDIEPDITLNGVRDQLQQVLTTMVDNAFYHTTPNGSIGITLSQNNRVITLTVSNTGKAIPPEEQEKLFQRFYRSDKSRSRENGHFGLGLSIAKTIVEQHNGSIKIHCEQGTTSFITTFRKQ